VIGLVTDGSPRLTFLEPQQKPRVIIATDNGIPSIALFDPAMIIRWLARVDAGGARVRMFDANSKETSQ
jgi:hypothetical protein